MASLILAKIAYLYCAQIKPFTDTVEAIHVVPQDTGQHWGEDGTCWCNPDRQEGNNEALPDTMILWIHKNYKPNWG